MDLRAQLQVQSLITGQLYVGLDYYPDTPLPLTGVDKEDCEIPTLPTTLAQFQETMKKMMAEIEQLPLKEIVISAARTLDGIDKFVQSGEVKKAPAGRGGHPGRGSVARAQPRFARFDRAADALQATLEQTKRTLDEVGRDVSKLVLNIDSQVGPLAPTSARRPMPPGPSWWTASASSEISTSSFARWSPRCRARPTPLAPRSRSSRSTADPGGRCPRRELAARVSARRDARRARRGSPAACAPSPTNSIASRTC